MNEIEAEIEQLNNQVEQAKSQENPPSKLKKLIDFELETL
jgi:hypothetical protein